MTALFLFCAFFILTPALCHAGAWTQPAGQWQTITSLNYYTTDHYRDDSGNLQPQNRFTKWELNPYAEYGLGDGLTVGADTFLQTVHQRQPTQSSNAELADTEFFARYRLFKNSRYVLSLQPLIKLPSLYRDEALPRAGEKHWDAELALQGGATFNWLGRSHFVEADAGYRFRDGYPKDQYITNLTVGFVVNDRWTIMPQLAGTWRTGETPIAAFVQSGDTNYDLLRGELSALYKFREDITLQFGAYSHLYARNTGTGGGLSVALWKSF